MATISAKELRANLSDYLKRAMNGEEIEVIYRSKPAVKIHASNKQITSNSIAVSAAIREYNKIKLNATPFDASSTPKDLYHDLLDQDIKYRRR